MFKYLRLYISKEKWLLNGLFASIIILILWMILTKYDEKVWFGYEFGIIISSISIGYIVSYIFNFIVVFVPRQKTKENTAAYIQLRLSSMCISALRIAKMLKINSRVSSCSFPLSEKVLIEIFNKLDPINSNCSTNQMLRDYNWFEYLKFVVVQESEAYINELFLILPHLDIELVKILNSIKDSELFNSSKREVIPLKQNLINARDGKIPKRLAQYFILIMQVDEYLNLNFSYEIKYQEDRKREMYEF